MVTSDGTISSSGITQAAADIRYLQTSIADSRYVGKSQYYDTTLLANSWTISGDYFTMLVPVSIVTTTNLVEIMPNSTSLNFDWIKAGIMATQSNGALYLTVTGVKPVNDIPIRIIARNDI